jgi:LL-diaminopimelate aminotransferase
MNAAGSDEPAAELIGYYLENAKFIREELSELGWEVFGGVNSPYVWFKTPHNQPSLKFFHELLYNYNIIGMPGIIFGKSGDGYMRFSGFCSYEDTEEAMKRIKSNY